MSNYGKNKNKTISFRTFEDVDKKLSALADRIKKHYWDFPWGSAIREADSKSGLINQVLSEELTFTQIREELKNVEAKDESN